MEIAKPSRVVKHPQSSRGFKATSPRVGETGATGDSNDRTSFDKLSRSDSSCSALKCPPRCDSRCGLGMTMSAGRSSPSSGGPATMNAVHLPGKSYGDITMPPVPSLTSKLSARFSTASPTVRPGSLQTNQGSSLPNRNGKHTSSHQQFPASDASTATSTPLGLRLQQLSFSPSAPPPRSNKGLVTPDTSTTYQPSHPSWAPPTTKQEGGVIEPRSPSCSRSPTRSGPSRSLRADPNAIELIRSPACMDTRMASPTGAQSPRFARSQVTRLASAPCLATASSSNSSAAPSRQSSCRFNGRSQMPAGGDLPSIFLSPFLSPRAQSPRISPATNIMGVANTPVLPPGGSLTTSAMGPANASVPQQAGSLATNARGNANASALPSGGSVATNTMGPANNSVLLQGVSVATNSMPPARTPAAPLRSPGCSPMPASVQRFSSAPSPGVVQSASTTREWQYPHSLNGSMQVSVSPMQAVVAPTLPAQGAELSNGAANQRTEMTKPTEIGITVEIGIDVTRTADAKKSLPVKVASQEVASTFAQMPFFQSQPGLSAFAFGQNAAKPQCTAARTTSSSLGTIGQPPSSPLPPNSPALTDTQLNYSAATPMSPGSRVINPPRATYPDYRSLSPDSRQGCSSNAFPQRAHDVRSLSPDTTRGFASIAIRQRTPDRRSLSPGPRRGVSPIAIGQRTPESRSPSPCPRIDSPRYTVANSSKPMSSTSVTIPFGGRRSPSLSPTPHQNIVRLPGTSLSPGRRRNGTESPRMPSPTKVNPLNSAVSLAPLPLPGPQHFSISTPRSARSFGQLTPRSLETLTPRTPRNITPGGSAQLPPQIVVSPKSHRHAHGVRPSLIGAKVNLMRPFKSRLVQKLMKQKSRKFSRRPRERVSFGFTCKPRVGEWIGLRSVKQGGVTFIMPDIPESRDSDSDASSSCPTIIEYVGD